MIRRFEGKDAQECSKIMIDCIEDSLGYEGKNKEFMITMSSPENLIKKSEHMPFFVFEKEGVLIGTGGIEEDEVKTMFIDPSHQKSGIGSEIIIFLIDFAKGKGYSKVWCKSSPEAELFYSKHGFKKIKDDYEYDFHTVFMEKVL